MKLSVEEVARGVPLSVEEKDVLARVTRSILSLTLEGALARAERFRRHIYDSLGRMPRCSEVGPEGACRAHHVRLETDDGQVVVRCEMCGAHGSYAVKDEAGKSFDYARWE